MTWRERAERTWRWLREEPAGQFVLVWAICAGCAGAGYYFGRKECRR